jgi:hydroxymethylglutaryl-CoA lyase
MVVYLSMAFGNPYGDAYNEDVLLHWAGEMARQEIKIISLADTVGLATPAQISFALETISGNFPDTEIGVHLHAAPHAWLEKTEAALTAGCTRFDGALKGFGGCPMADDRLVGNVAMEEMIRFFKEKDLINNLDGEALAHSLTLAGKIFVD